MNLPGPIVRAMELLAEERQRTKLARKTLNRLEYRARSAEAQESRLRARDEARSTQFRQDMIRSQIRRERSS